MSVVAVQVLVVVYAVPSVDGMVALVRDVVVVADVGVVFGHVLCLRRLLRAEIRTVAGRVSCKLVARWRSLCHRVGLCHGLVVARSRAGRSHVDALCRRADVVTAVHCGAAAVCLVRSRAVADCGGLGRVVNVQMLRAVGCVLLLVFFGRVGALTLSGRSSWCC